jgi:hypothetical protein
VLNRINPTTIAMAIRTLFNTIMDARPGFIGSRYFRCSGGGGGSGNASGLNSVMCDDRRGTPVLDFGFPLMPTNSPTVFHSDIPA